MRLKIKMNKFFKKQFVPLLPLISGLIISGMSSSVMAMEKGKSISYDPNQLIYAGMFFVKNKTLKEAIQTCENNDGAILTRDEVQSYANSGALKDGMGNTGVAIKEGNDVIGFNVFPSPIPALNKIKQPWSELYCKPAKIDSPKFIQLKASTTFAQAQTVCKEKGANLLSSEDAINLGNKFVNRLKHGKETLEYISAAKMQLVIVPYYESKQNYGYRIIGSDGSTELGERNIYTEEMRPYPGSTFGLTLDIGPNHPADEYFYLQTKYGKSKSIKPNDYALISGCTK